MSPLPPIRYGASESFQLAYDVANSVVPCICGGDPALAKDEDMDGTYYEIECETCELRVDGRTLDRAADAWLEAVRAEERKLADCLELQREGFGCRCHERRTA